jgi:hypothetical protein
VVVLLLAGVAAAVAVPTLLRLRARRAREAREAREARIAAAGREEWRPEALAARVRARFGDEIARRGGDPAEARLGAVEIVRVRSEGDGWGFTAHVAFAARLPRGDGRPARRPRRHAELWRCAPDGTPSASRPARRDDPDLNGPAVPGEG